MMRKLTFILLFFLAGISLIVAQNTQVAGTVISGDDGLPIAGASIVVKGTTIGTVTDYEGKFTLEVPSGADILRFSFVGMKTQEIAVKPVMAVTLLVDAENLDEVVVTAQGLTRKQKSLGYAVQQVKADELQNVRQTDLNNALAGKVAGIRFLGGSGAKFDPGKIVLRGTSQLTEAGGSEPLYVVDGVITSVNSVNMDDVESVNVLKGPAATALYGSRGGNGAIIVTTKGLSGENMEFNVSHTLSFEKVYLHSKMQDQYGGGYYGANGQMDVFHYDPSVHPSYLQRMDGIQYYDYADDASWGPVFDGREYAPWYAWDPTSSLFGKTDKWVARMDLKDLFDTGMTNTTNLSFARSGKDYMTRVSFTNSAREGVAPNSDAVRRFLSAKTQFKPVDRLTISLDYKYTYRKNHNAAVEGYAGTGNVLYSYLQWGQTNVDLSKLRNDYRRPDGTFRTWNIIGPTNVASAFHENPFVLYNEINNTDITQWNVFSGDAQLELPWNLKAGIKVNGNIRNERVEGEMPMNVIGEVARYNEENNSLIDMQVQGRLTWGDRLLDDRLSLDAALFLESRNYTDNQVNAFTRDGLFLNKFFSAAGSLGLSGGNTIKTEVKEQSIYGTGTIGWEDTYYLDFSLRNDWTSTLHPDRNSYLYGGLSAAVIASNWLKEVEWLDFWKIRASMAQVGSTMDAYNVYKVYQVKDTYGNTVKYGSLSNIWNDANLKDPYIKPTISTSYEVGMEFRMFGSRLWGDVNFYNRDSKDQIIDVNTTPASGFKTRKMNAGLIRNRGIELSVGGMPVNTKDWTWEVNANISHNRNTLEELVEGQDAYQLNWTSWLKPIYSYAEVGKPIGVIRGSKWKRDPEGRIILSERSDPNHAYGPYAPLVGDNAQEELGNIQPDLTGGFSTSLRYKNFRLGATFDFQIGGQLASATNLFGEGSGTLASTVGVNDKGNPIRNSVADGGGVRVDGVVDNGDGTFKPVTAYVDANYYFMSCKRLVWEEFVYDAGYLKLRELSLTYDLPQSFLKKTKTGLKKAQLSFVAQNPWLICSGIPNIDASESGNAKFSTVEGGQAASTRSFGFTVNVTF